MMLRILWYDLDEGKRCVQRTSGNRGDGAGAGMGAHAAGFQGGDVVCGVVGWIVF